MHGQTSGWLWTTRMARMPVSMNSEAGRRQQATATGRDGESFDRLRNGTSRRPRRHAAGAGGLQRGERRSPRPRGARRRMAARLLGLPTSPGTATATSPSGTATVTVPAAARAHTDEGAKAFAVFYLEIYSDSAVRADSAALRVLSAPGCGGCQSLFDLLDEYRAKGQHVNKSSLVVKESSLRPEGSKDRPVVDVLAIDNPKQILRQDGSLVSKVAGANINFRLTEEWTGTGLEND